MSAGASLTPVSPERHGARRWRRFTSYAFVQAHPLVPIVLGEEMQVAASLPILFAPLKDQITPVAVTRLGATTALVAASGTWRGSYVPSLLRVHPFAARQTEGGKFALLVDEQSGLLSTDPADPAFFDTEGEIAPELAQVVAFFRSRVQAEAETRLAMAALARTRLLVPASLPEGSSLPEGLLDIDPAALARLGRVDLAELHRTGALGLVYGARVAHQHLGFLAAAEDHLTRAPAPSRQTAAQAPAPPDAGLGSFFDAFASAQAQDHGLAEFIRPGMDPDPPPER